MAARNSPSEGRKPDKPWRDALAIAAKRTEDETAALLADKSAPIIAKAAARLMLTAADGDVAAGKEIGDRLDGKPKQQIEADVNADVGIRIVDARSRATDRPSE